MTIKVSKVLENAAFALQDNNEHVRWRLPELLAYFNDGLLQLIAFVPTAYSEARVVSLAAGPRQVVTGVYSILRFTANLDPATEAFTRAMNPSSKAQLDAFDPDWYQQPVSPTVLNYAVDPVDKQVAWVYPPNDGTGKVQAQVSLIPPAFEVAQGDDENLLASYDTHSVAVEAIYAPALTYYVLHRAWAKDADFAINQQNANRYYELFLSALGVERPQ